MPTARFSAKGLRAEVRSTDGYDYGVDFSVPIDSHIADAEKILKDPHNAIHDFNCFQLGSKKAVSYTSYPTVLALRLLGTYLKRRYSLQTETREFITRGVIQALSDSTEMTILRRDISSFYECVPTHTLREELLFKDVLPPRARRMLEVFFEAHCTGGLGLPRGLGLSAVLSEYVMLPADGDIRLIPGVYRYHRFVDDLIIFCTGEAEGVLARIKSALPEPLRLNTSKYKSDDVFLAKPSGENQLTCSFEYLGYKYSVDHNHAKKHPRKLRVSIAERKVRKIQSRLIRSARAFVITGDYNLFVDRVRYLTGNYKFSKKRSIAATGSAMVKSGIFYNYKYCGDFQGARRVPHKMPELRRLDWFLQNSILGNRHPTGQAVLNNLNAAQIQVLRRISFAQGHLKVYHSAFSSARIKLIKGVWNHG